DLSMEIPVFEPRDGGRWDWVFTAPDGDVQRFHGVTHGTPSVENGIMGTSEWLGLPGHVSFQTMTFDEHDGRTTLRSNSVFQTLEDRDGMIASGMESGMNQGYAKLDKLLAPLTTTQREEAPPLPRSPRSAGETTRPRGPSSTTVRSSAM